MIPNPADPPSEDPVPENDYPLTPDSADSERVPLSMLPWLGPEKTEPPPAERPGFRFSIADLLLVMTGTALVMGGLRRLCGPPPIFAGVAGIGVMLGTVFLAFMKPDRPVFHLAWWAMLAIYLAACVVALVSN
jgi:hypothetical protein